MATKRTITSIHDLCDHLIDVIVQIPPREMDEGQSAVVNAFEVFPGNDAPWADYKALLDISETEWNDECKQRYRDVLRTVFDENYNLSRLHIVHELLVVANLSDKLTFEFSSPDLAGVAAKGRV